MPLQISSQPAVLAWNKQNASLEYSRNSEQILDITTTKPRLEMQTTKPVVLIDQTQPFSEAGLKNISAFMNDAVSYSQEVLSAGIGRIISQGNDMMNIQTNSDPIPDHAIYNAYEMFEKSFVYGVIPKSRPVITLERGTVTTSFIPGEVVNNTVPNRIDMQYTPWQMDFYLKQYASISFRYEEPQLNLSV